MCSDILPYTLIYLLARFADLAPLLDEFADWKEAGCTVVISGAINHRPNDGMIILQWDKPVPEPFRKKLDDDPSIIDHTALTIGSTDAITVEPAW